MSDEVNPDSELEYVDYKGNRFLIDKGVLKDVQVQSKVVCLPESVKEIRRQAFLDTRLIGRMEILVIPPSVGKIEYLTFAGMSSLKQVEMQAQIATLERGMFRNCMELEEIILPNTLRKIDSRAFENCLKLKKVVLPRNWVQMEEDSFINCVNLKEKRIQNGIEEAQYRRKKEEAAAKKARFPHLYEEEEKKKKLKKAEPEVVSESQVAEQKSAAEELLEAALLAEQQADMQLQIVPQEEELPELRFCIHEGVLERCEVYGSSVIIPEGVTALADRLFYGMKHLEEIVFPSTLSYIGVQALEGTGWLEKERKKNNYVVVNGILVSAFHNSMVLEAKLPDTVYRIAPYAFYRSEAQLVIFSESVREVDARAFVESEVTEIDFSERADIMVHPPLAVRCGKLREIYIPGKLERLEENFVEDCPAMKRVCLKWAQTVVNKKAFPENVRIWVL